MYLFELLTVTFLVVLASAILMVRYGYAPSPYPESHSTQDTNASDENPISLVSNITPSSEKAASDPNSIIANAVSTSSVENTYNHSNVLKRNKLPGKTYAIIIGANQYSDSTLRDLNFIRRDAEELATVLRENYSVSSIALLTGEKASKQNIRGVLNEMSQILTPEDTLLFYFAGHGILEHSKDVTQANKLYLTTFDTKPNMLDLTAIDLNDIKEFTETCSSRKILLILDACYTGNITQMEIDKSIAQLSDIFQRGSERALITAIGSETSDHKIQHLFSKYLIKALEGAALDDSGQLIRVRALYSYIKNRINRDEQDKTPSMYLAGASDNFSILKVDRA